MPLPIAAALGVWGMVPNWAKVAMGGAAALFITYQVGYWRGDNHRDAIWQAKIKAEIAQQEKVVDAAKDAAIKEVIRLNEELEERDAQIATMQAEADADANAKRPAFGADSLRRINRGRKN